MGSSWGSSLACPVGATLPTDPACVMHPTMTSDNRHLIR
jgi:hypothetical protein